MNVYDLTAKIGLDTSSYDRGLLSSKSKMAKFGAVLGKGIGAAAKTGVAAIAAVGTAAIGTTTAIVKATNKVSQHGDEIDKMSQKLGLSTDAYQEWDYVLSLAGTSIGNMSMGLKTMTNKVDKAKNGGKDAQAMFEKLGISLEDLNSMSREDIFAATINGFQKMEDSTERAALANQLFGRSGQELTPLFNQTTKSTKQLKKAAHDLGFVMSKESVNNAAKFQDSLETLKRTFQGAKTSMLADFMPSITKIMDGLSLLLSGRGGLKKINKGIEDFLDKIAKKTPKIIALAQTIIGAVGKSIIKNLPNLIQTGTGMIEFIVKGIVTALPELIRGAGMIISELVDTLTGKDGQQGALDAGVEFITNMMDSLTSSDSFSEVVDGAISLVGRLARALIENAAKLVVAASKLLKRFIKELTTPDEDGKSKLVKGFRKMFKNVDWHAVFSSLGKLVGETFVGAIRLTKEMGLELGKKINKWLDEDVVVNFEGKEVHLSLGEKGIKSAFVDPLGEHIATSFRELADEGFWSYWGGEGSDDFYRAYANYLEENPFQALLEKWYGSGGKKTYKTWTDKGTMKFFTVEEQPGVYNQVITFRDKILDFFKSIPQQIADEFKSIPTKIGAVFDTLSGLGSSLDTWMNEHVVTPIANWFKAIPEKVGEAFNAGLDLIAGFKDGILDGLKNIDTWLREHIFDPFMKGIKSLFGIASPSKVLKQMGEYTIQGFFMGVSSFFSNIYNWLKTNVFEPFMNTIKSLFGIASPSTVLKDIGDNVIAGFVEGIEEKKDWLITKVESVFGGIVGVVKKIFKQKSPSKVFAEIGRYNVLGLAEGWNEEMPKFLDTVNDDLDLGGSMGLGFDDSELRSVMTIDRSDDPLYSSLQSSIDEIKGILATINVDMVNSIDSVNSKPLKVDSRTFGRAVRGVHA